jgi:hypothetical protein
MEKQLVIQLLPLPRELLSIIKEYTFYHIDYIIARRQYNQIIHVMNRTLFKQSIDYKFWFWSENWNDPQFQADFCMVCGNYIMPNNTCVPCTC